jgi:hypothetical protein
MNKFLRGALSIGVALVAFYGIQALRQHSTTSEQSTAEAVNKRMDELRARAEREHPDMAKSDALKEVASKEAAKKLATQTSSQQVETAASMFWGFYWINTKARADYCTRRGVDLGPFVTAFESEHSAELARAKAVFAATGTDPAEIYPVLLPRLEKTVEQDMKDVATGANAPLEEACNLFNEHAEQFAKFIQMPPHVKEALMTEG